MTNSIKVIIVDDEKLERNLLKKCINWKYLNMEIVAEASNADEALRFLESNTVDIVFTDIHMPVVDGMHFISIAAKRYPQIKFVVLTGYDDFSYAQKSVKLGVSDFLVKPIDDEDVFKTLSNLKSIIEQEKEEQNEYNRLKKQLYDNLPYLKKHFLCELITGGINKNAIEEKLLFLNIQFKYKSFQIAALKINHSEKGNEELRYIKNIKVMNLVKTYFADNQYVYSFFDSVNHIIVLNNDENMDLLACCELLNDRIAEELNCSVGIGLGSLKIEPQEICISYREALDALDFRITVGNDAVILYDHINYNNIQESKLDLTELYNKFSLYLKSGLKDKAKEVIEFILDSSIDLKSASVIHQIHDIAIEISLICLKYSIHKELDTENQYKADIQSLSQVFTMVTIPEIKEYLFHMVEKTTKEMGQQQINRINKLILNIKTYLDNNFSNHDLTLAKVAKIFYLNPSYLSRTFKKETGISFIKYLTTVRMEKAINLLTDKEDIKVFEIADAVGISDPNYFGTCFKKYTGMSISEYKNKI